SPPRVEAGFPDADPGDWVRDCRRRPRMFFGLPYETLALFVAACGEAGELKYARPEFLIEASALAKPGATTAFRVLDTRDKARYQAGHIPGAVWLPVGDWGRAFGDGRDAAGWAKRLGALGIDPDRPVVLYGDATSPDAARAWWILRYWGAGDVRLLNGGWG